MTRIAQLLLVLAAAGLWGASRLTWVQITSFDGLGQPKATDLAGSTWSTALIPLALLVLAAAVAALAVRGWALRVLAVLVAAASAGMGYLAISLWVMADDAARAARLAEVPVADLLDTERHYTGAVITLVAAVLSLSGAVLLMRSATHRRAEAVRYSRRPAQPEDGDADMSERMMWDALDEGRDPTNPDNQGR
ncbi:TIGR02234 family membrane protein [Mycobacterium sp. 4D054]|uniref:TIGR02234 family membrane protein n=1 Tax=unclassified Mycobacterium TaxID=2642494 RepID=UPI0021B3A402|nr:TIGR02234 family membrane protein [Mycobacterium sp. SMC-8]UXA10658.1 TIGR02234 family membrane protein [Mycobacterium sp. SMC-8]